MILTKVLLNYAIVGFVFSLFMLFRNNQILDYRTKVLNRSLSEYQALPSYDTMFYKFWVYPLNKFNKAEK